MADRRKGGGAPREPQGFAGDEMTLWDAGDLEETVDANSNRGAPVGFDDDIDATVSVDALDDRPPAPSSVVSFDNDEPTAFADVDEQPTRERLDRATDPAPPPPRPPSAAAARAPSRSTSGSVARAPSSSRPGVTPAPRARSNEKGAAPAARAPSLSKALGSAGLQQPVDSGKPAAPAARKPTLGARPSSNKRAQGDADGFGPYTLGPPVGTGGMAEVRLGYEKLPNGEARPCVIKRIAAAYVEDDSYQEMFREEIRLSRMMNHPNVVRAFADGEHDGRAYIVFELIDGVSLLDFQKLAAVKAIPVSVVLEIGIAVADALAYAHALTGPDGNPLHIVHRDVSPQNVLISQNGHVKLVDFGIARFEGREVHTMAGEVKGKMRYMAPEQLAQKELDARTDIFALGIVLAELLDALQPGLTDHFVSGVRAQAGSLPPALHHLLVRMAAPRMADRPSSAKMIAQELRKVLGTVDRSVTLADFGAREVFPKRAAPGEKVRGKSAPGKRASGVMPSPIGAVNAMSSAPKPRPPQAIDFDAAPAGGEPSEGYADTVLRYKHMMPEPPVSLTPAAIEISQVGLAKTPAPAAQPDNLGLPPGMPPLPGLSNEMLQAMSVIMQRQQSMLAQQQQQKKGLPSWLIWVLASVLAVAAAGLLVLIALRK